MKKKVVKPFLEIDRENFKQKKPSLLITGLNNSIYLTAISVATSSFCVSYY